MRHLAFLSFPLQDKVWLFLSTSSWANRISFQRLDPERNDFFFNCWFLMQKRIYILPLPSKLRADRPSLYIRVELCIWTSLILDMLLIATRLVFIFSRMLSMKRGHAKQTSIVNDTSKDKVLACSGKRKKKKCASTVKNRSRRQDRDKTQVCHLKACFIAPEPCGSLLGKVSVAAFPYTIYYIV